MADITDYTPDPNNANRGTQRGEGMLERSLQEHGAGRSILVDKNGVVIAGNKTHQKAAELGFAVREIETDGKELVVVRRKDLDLNSPDAQALAIADNRVGEISLDWDPNILQGLPDEVVEDFWHPEEFEALLEGVENGENGAGEPGADVEPEVSRADELAEEYGTKVGQIWQLGEHRLAVGDCTDQAVVEALEVEKDFLLFTDPPYGINIDTSWLTALNVKRGKPGNKSDDMLAGDDGTLEVSWLYEFSRRFIWGFPYVFDPQATGWIVWDKQPGLESRGIVTPIEMASTTLRQGFDMVRCMWGGYYKAAGETREPHPTQKPLGVCSPFLEKWANAEDIVFDPFVGSGTTLIACENLNRRCRAIEIDPGYAAVTLKRLHDLTGQEPKLLEG